MRRVCIKVFIFLILLICLVRISFFTKFGSKIISNQILALLIHHEDYSYSDIKGSLAEGLQFHNLSLEDIKGLPEGSTIKFQKLYINYTGFNLDGLVVEIENARLKLPVSDPIVLSGVFKDKQLDFNVYSNGFTVHQILTYLPDLKQLIPIKGTVDHFDLFIRGFYDAPIVTGTLLINKFLYKGFVLSQVPININTQIKNVKSNTEITGEILLEKGTLQSQRVMVNLEPSRLRFNKVWNQPQLNIKGNTRVDSTRINISLKGTIDKPDLNLTSEPSYSKQKLMVMLATGKSWQSVEDSLDNGLNSAALTKDFVDYFLFAGKSNKFAKKFGISDFSVKFDEGERGISAKKDITDKLRVGYGIEQRREDGLITDVSQKIEGQYKVTDNVSVSAERELIRKTPNEVIDEQLIENNDRIMLKYKKSF